MRKTSALGLAATAAAAALVGVAAPASADTTWTVSPGGATTATAGTTTVKDSATGTAITCTSSTADATVASGTGLSGTGIATVNSIALNGCTGPLGISFSGSITSTASLNAESYADGVTSGSLTGIQGSGSSFLCSFTVAGTSASTPGTVTGTYTNSTSTLSTSGGDLHIWNVSGCFGFVKSGDPVTFTASYALSPAQTITSP
jgi:hypothetical protein